MIEFFGFTGIGIGTGNPSYVESNLDRIIGNGSLGSASFYDYVVSQELQVRETTITASSSIRTYDGEPYLIISWNKLISNMVYTVEARTLGGKQWEVYPFGSGSTQDDRFLVKLTNVVSGTVFRVRANKTE